MRSASEAGRYQIRRLAEDTKGLYNLKIKNHGT